MDTLWIENSSILAELSGDVSVLRRSVAEQAAYDPQTVAELYYMYTLINVI